MAQVNYIPFVDGLPNCDIGILYNKSGDLLYKGKVVNGVVSINDKIFDIMKDDVTKIKKKDNKNLLECCICMDNIKNVIFENCTHVACCKECSKKINKCPICQKKITKITNIYI